MANLEGMPISALPELTGDLQDEDEIVVYRPSTGKAYQANTDLIDSSTEYITETISQPTDPPDGITLGSTWVVRVYKTGKVVNLRINANGTIKSGGNFKTMFTLSSGYAPSGVSLTQSYASQDGTPMCVQVSTSGNVSFYSGTGNSSSSEFIFRQNLTWIINS